MQLDSPSQVGGQDPLSIVFSVRMRADLGAHYYGEHATTTARFYTTTKSGALPSSMACVLPCRMRNVHLKPLRLQHCRARLCPDKRTPQIFHYSVIPLLFNGRQFPLQERFARPPRSAALRRFRPP